MGDYISRDVTYTLAKRINDKIINGEYHAATFGGVILDMIDELPPADVVEVIRCKDCKYRDDDDFCIGRGYPNSLVPDDGFCDKGERRADE